MSNTTEPLSALIDAQIYAPNDLVRVIVRSKCREASNIISLELANIDGAPLPPFAAGAHVNVHLPSGMTRPYSLCNNPNERDRYVIAILRDAESRGGSSMLHDQVQRGDFLSVSKPINNFALVEDAPATLLFAGGIGITPLLAMVERLTDLQAEFQLHYYARSPEHMAFRDRLENLRFAHCVHLHFDNGTESQHMNVNMLLARPIPNTHTYVCGPAGFIDHVISRARANGWADWQIHREYFATSSLDPPAGNSFRIKIASTGAILNVPEDQNVIAVLAQAGVEIPVACEQGVCGTCLTGVLAGHIEHRDLFLTENERATGRQFLPCCSRGKGLVVLDL